MLTHSWWAKLIIGLDVIVPLLCFCPGEFNVGGGGSLFHTRAGRGGGGGGISCTDPQGGKM